MKELAHEPDARRYTLTIDGDTLKGKGEADFGGQTCIAHARIEPQQAQYIPVDRIKGGHRRLFLSLMVSFNNYL